MAESHHRLASIHLGNERDLWLRPPPGSARPARLAVFLDAERYRDPAPRMDVLPLLDKLVADLPKEADVDVAPLAKQLAGRPLSDVSFVVREGARLAARSGKDRLSQESLLAALRSAPARGPEGAEKRRIGFI